MKRVLSIAAALAVLAAPLPGLAQATPPAAMPDPGVEFMAQWDLDGSGKVTLDEARDHRSDIFTMFDTDENGSFSAEELAGIDEHKLMQAEAGMGPGHQMPEGMQPPPGRGPGQGMGAGQGMGPGQGQGKGMGQGRGMGQGMAMGQAQGMGMGFSTPAAQGMMMFDGNGDGLVTKTEFVKGTATWFAMRDRNGDGAITPEDFGPRR